MYRTYEKWEKVRIEALNSGDSDEYRELCDERSFDPILDGKRGQELYDESLANSAYATTKKSFNEIVEGLLKESSILVDEGLEKYPLSSEERTLLLDIQNKIIKKQERENIKYLRTLEEKMVQMLHKEIVSGRIIDVRTYPCLVRELISDFGIKRIPILTRKGNIPIRRTLVSKIGDNDLIDYVENRLGKYGFPITVELSNFSE